MRHTRVVAVCLVLLLCGAEAVNVAQTTSAASAMQSNPMLQFFHEVTKPAENSNVVTSNMLSMLFSPTVQQLPGLFENLGPLKMVPMMLAEHPQAAKTILQSPYMSKITNIIRASDMERKDVPGFGKAALPKDINTDWLNTQYAKDIMARAQTKGDEWKQVMFEVMAGSPPPASKHQLAPHDAILGTFLEESSGLGDDNTTSRNNLGEATLPQNAEAYRRAPWMKNIDTVSYVWWGLFWVGAAGLLVAIIASLYKFKKIRQTRLGGNLMVGMILFLAFIAIIAVEQCGLNMMLKNVLVTVVNSLLFLTSDAKALVNQHMGPAKMDIVDAFTIGHLQAEARSTAKLANRLSYNPYANIDYRFENICQHAYMRGLDYYMTDRHGTNISVTSWDDWDRDANGEVITKRMVYASEGPKDTWNPIARWNLHRRPHEKKIPLVQKCCVEPVCYPPSKEDCPGYWMYLEGKDDQCDCLESLMMLGYATETTDLTACVLRKRNLYISHIQEIFGEDVEYAADRVERVAKQIGCWGSFHVGGASLDQGGVDNPCLAYTTTRALTTDSDVSLAGSTYAVNMGGDAVGGWTKWDATSGITVDATALWPEWHAKPAVSAFQNDLNDVCWSVVWADTELKVTADVDPGSCYRAQLVAYEREGSRRMTVSVNGASVEDDFNPYEFNGNQLDSGAILDTQFVGGVDGKAVISLTPHANSEKPNAILSGFVLSPGAPVAVKKFQNFGQLDTTGHVLYKVNMGGDAVLDWTALASTAGVTVSGASVTVSVPTEHGITDPNGEIGLFSTASENSQAPLEISLSLAAGKWYRIQLLFLDTQPSNGRVMRVDVDGETVMAEFSPSVVAGGSGKAAVLTAHFRAVTHNAVIRLTEVSGGHPFANAFTVAEIDLETSVSHQLYYRTSLPDASAEVYQYDSVATFGRSDTKAPSATWTIRSCAKGQYSMDFRYASDHPIEMEVLVDGEVVSSVLVPATDGRLMRNSFAVAARTLDAGNHDITVRKKEGQVNPGPTLHRFNVCPAAISSSTGCHLHRMNDPIYCFESLGGQTIQPLTAPSGIGGTGDMFGSLDEAKSNCAARSDCDGVQQLSITDNGVATPKYILSGGALTSTTDTSKIVYRKRYCNEVQ